MIDHVVEIEGPIYLDAMIDRIARAHGFQRSGEIVQRVVRGALGRFRFPSTKDGDREIWPQNVTVGKKTPYRGAGGREHGDIPLPELAGLAELLRTQGLEDEEDLIRGIQEHFGLGRLASPRGSDSRRRSRWRPPNLLRSQPRRRSSDRPSQRNHFG
jgi:Protein of unknown function (DUF3320)